MKKYVNPIPNGGAPLHNNRITSEFQTEIWDAMQAIMSLHTTFTEGIIVGGCVITPNAGTPANFDMTAGIVFLNGEFMRIPAATNQTFTKYISPKAVTYEAKVFADAASKNLIEVKEAELTVGAPGAGQYVLLSDFAAGFRKNVSAMYPGVEYVTSAGASSYKRIRTKVLEIGDWNMDSGSTKTVTHFIPSYKKIRRISVIIRDDADTDYYDFLSQAAGAGGVNPAGRSGYIAGFNAAIPNRITLVREATADGGIFDNTAFDSTGYNRGWVTIEYEE